MIFLNHFYPVHPVIYVRSSAFSSFRELKIKVF